mmetsp:Transcript_37237/g.117173  ORF Transcript_37237/g.117173 Transcript_37237/m.117173 type:complete len:87 (+) Transcript_37237:239-499(+)
MGCGQSIGATATVYEMTFDMSNTSQDQVPFNLAGADLLAASSSPPIVPIGITTPQDTTSLDQWRESCQHLMPGRLVRIAPIQNNSR